MRPPLSHSRAGRSNFGFTADQTGFDDTLACVRGTVRECGSTQHRKQRTCAICHRPDTRDKSGNIVEELNLGLPHELPLSNVIPPSDPLFTGHIADDGGHPDRFRNLNEHALIAIKPGRFKPLIADDSPFRQVQVWRTSNRKICTGSRFPSFGISGN